MTTQRVRLLCPNCHESLLVRAANLGRKGVCRHCGHRFLARTDGDLLSARLCAEPSAAPGADGRLVAPDGLVAELKEALDQLGAELDQHRTAHDELENARASLDSLEAREHELLAELAERDRRLLDHEALQNELARRFEEAQHQEAKLAELQHTVARVASERDDAARHGREQHDRAESECVALAREILQLEERIAALQADHAATHGGRDRAVTAARQALSALQHTHAETVADRDVLLNQAATLEQRLEVAFTAHKKLDAELHAGREQWAAERTDLEARSRNALESLRAHSNTQCTALREQLHRLYENLTAQRNSRRRTAAALRRIRASWAARTRDARAHWDEERQALLDGAERALTERIEELQAERQDLRHELKAARRAGDALDSTRRELESLRGLLEETRRERDSALQVAEGRGGAESASAQLRDELAQLRDEQRTRDAQHEESVQSLRQERDSALRLAEARGGEEGALAQVREELAQLHDEQRARGEQQGEALSSLRRERDNAARERDEARSHTAERERELAVLRDGLATASASHAHARAEGATEVDRLHALLQEITGERDGLRSQLDTRDSERRTLHESVRAAKTALERGRTAAIQEVERLQQLVTEVTRERDDARRRLKTHHGARSKASEATAKATTWLDAVLGQMESAAPGAIQGQKMLADRLRMVRAALAERAAAPAARAQEPPRPRADDFRDPTEYRTAVAAWLDEARAHREDVSSEMERLTAEVQSANDELGLLDRDLALGHWNDEDPDAFAFDGVAAIAEARLEQAQ